MALMSQSEYARHRAVTKQFISKLVKAGRISLVDGKVDAELTDQLLGQNLDPARGGKGGAPIRESLPELPAPKEGTFTFERAQREGVERKLKQLELDRQLGAVVEFAAFAAGMEEAASACRKECEGMIQRLPSLVAAEHDVRRCRQLIEAEVSRAMETLADTCMALAAKRRSATSQ